MTREEELLRRLDNAKKRYEVKCQELDECSKFSTQQAFRIHTLENRICEWKHEEYSTYETTCGNLWQFIEGTLEDNKIEFCPFCGGRICQ